MLQLHNKQYLKINFHRDKALTYSLRPMCKEDISQVNEIDREAFPTQWPPANYQHELQNRLARYIVAIDESKTIEETGVKVYPDRGIYRLVSRVKQWLNHGRFSGSTLSPTGRQYIIGFAGIWVLADEAHITNIAVRNHYQRQGIGELLLISLTDLSRELNASIMTLEVRASNTAAQNLYKKYGFTEVGLRRGYYTDNHEDGILMSTESITSASFQAQLKRLRQAHSKKEGG